MSYLLSATKQFRYYKSLGDKAMAQVSDAALLEVPNAVSNSIAMIVQHLHGNMLSRWTDLLTTDGEKPNRNRDAEFEASTKSRQELLQQWEEGWQCLFHALEALSESDLDTLIYIRNEGHTVQEAINRQLAHYPYHVGQLVYIARMFTGDNWQSLSIPRNNSAAYNQEKFNQEKGRRHFTDNV